MYDYVIPVLDLDYDIEGGWRTPLQHCLLRSAPARLLIAESDCLDATDKVAQGWVLHEIFQLIAVGGSHQLNSAFGDGSCRCGFELRTNLVNDNNLRHMVFYSFNHHRMLSRGGCHLHASGP